MDLKVTRVPAVNTACAEAHQITNHGSGDIKVNVPISAYHAAYPSQHLVCIPYCVPQRSTGKVYSSVAKLVIPVAQGTTTPKWVEVGSRLDTL